ncbi:transcriptional regulator, AraC family [Fibrisoma limi BUZ 3]|uniref:Transcriptional regulator, AraC family n=1 Tax=Fibrisoma limi BUZ 3 TaxID=1185876 RepID=I2GCV8_9BACT|nr:helix-turn-helix domain-containing protein [Fibrisoma limi]CCH51732.1 transcriptional regulator, AraC family [Fibrisoma limi BUZ 3]
MLVDFIRLVILIGGIQGIVLGLVHLVKRPCLPWDRWMALLLLTFAPSNVFLWLLGWQGSGTLDYPQILSLRLVLLLPLNSVLMPIFFLLTYVKHFTNAEKDFARLTTALKWAAIIELLGHLMPFGAALYLSSLDKDLIRFALTIKKAVNIGSIPFAIATMVVIRQLAERYRRQLAHLPAGQSGYRIRWIWTLFGIFVLIFALVTFPLIYSFLFDWPGQWLYYPQGLAVTVALFWVSLNSLMIDSRIASDTAQNTTNLAPQLSPPAQQRIYQEFQRLLTDEHLYKNPSLKLSDLAGRLDLTPNYLSRIINQEAKKSFNDLLNEYRVDEVKRLLTEPAFQHYTLESLGREAGFNAKSTFQAVFKKVTGLTPSQYKDNQRLKL